ncbi:TetR/AcrR family transcriptional regulator [Methylophaga sp.]|uniref:TetR/AcrR family transcriptional regulator n=1 Tax=Methylophaga sp. TaxID=2024840 RepID=UPI00271730A4|nr:TetR/AcrR family transcriptional regulator [Methylophaga sp.]MDO8826854.1 TetR/AcrR family transcriptional regulator [Methylophaga sp.]
MAKKENMKSSSKPRKKSTEVILQAAEKVFVERGYGGASMQAIADEAGLPKANIHYYFTSKEKLYSEVLTKIIASWNSVMDSVSVDDDPAKVLEQFIYTKVELAYRFPQASKLFAMEIIQGAPHLKDYIRMDMRNWVREKSKVFQTWMDQGKMKNVDPVHLIFLIWSSTQHYADFETQVLTIMNRAEYEEEDILNSSRFLSSIILTGVGLKPSHEKL